MAEGRRLVSGHGSFDWRSDPHLIFAPGSINCLPGLLNEARLQRVLLVSDVGVAAAGHVKRVVDHLSAAGLAVFTWTETEQNPSDLGVERCFHYAKDLELDAIVGLGGGSAMDTARATVFLLADGPPMLKYRGFSPSTKATSRPFLPLFLVPTTAGTGSETQCFALISESKTHVKFACGDRRVAAKVAILDPELTLTMPPQITAESGCDALVHALETAVTKAANPISLMFAKTSYAALSENLQKVLEDPRDVEARGKMLWGASLAGLAIENSMLGAAHALANPLTAEFGLVHGAAVTATIIPVMKLNAQDELNRQRYRDLAPKFKDFDAFIAANDLLLSRASENLDYGCLTQTSVALETLIDSALEQWTGTFNPIALDRAIVASLYQHVFQRLRQLGIEARIH